MPPYPRRTLWPLVSRTSLLSLSLVAVLSACGSGPTSGAAPRATVPTPDLCKTISPKVVTAALYGRSTGCETSGDASGFTARFTGTARLSGRRVPAELTVGYSSRHDARTGADAWATVGRPTRTRVQLLGVGEKAVFDPDRAPQLRFVQRELIVSIGLAFTGAKVPQAKLPGNLLAVALEAAPPAR
jgi:hypothetical protein